MKELIILSILCSFIIVTLLLVMFTALHNVHDCIKSPCDLCPLLKQAKQITESVLLTIFTGVCMVYAVFTAIKFDLLSINLINMKARMNN